MNKLPISKYPSTFYRVSLKAIIQNDAGEVLCVKENGSDWTLPGGGLDHGETIEQGLIRELHEELSFNETATFSYKPVGHDVMWVESKKAWQLWVLFCVNFTRTPEFSRGIDADDVAFINPHMFKNSKQRAQRLIYKWCVDSSYDASSFL